jgi:hypothetical protein
MRVRLADADRPGGRSGTGRRRRLPEYSRAFSAGVRWTRAARSRDGLDDGEVVTLPV